MADEPAVFLTFFTAHAALSAEKIAHAAGLAARLLPPPRWVSADCAAALALPGGQEERLLDLLRAARVEVAGRHRRQAPGAGPG